MTGSEVLLKPSDCMLLLVDFQAGLGFGVESINRQALLNNAVAALENSDDVRGSCCGIDVCIARLQRTHLSRSASCNAFAEANRT